MSAPTGNRRKPGAVPPRRPDAAPAAVPAPPAAPAPPANARTAMRRGGRLRAWREQHAASLRASLARLGARPGATALTFCVMSLALTFPLLLWLLLDNARGLGGNVDDARALSAFLKPAVAAPAAQALAERLRARADVAQVVLRTPDEGLAEFRAQSGFGDALKLLESNPLPAVLVITLRQAPVGGTPPALVADLGAMAEVDLVQFDALWRQRLDAILAFTARLTAVIAALLALAALLVVGNSVRLDVQGRAEEIGIVQLLGASHAFVRRPFLYSGLCYGLASGLIALAVVFGVEALLAAPLRDLVRSYDAAFSVHGLGLAPAAAVVVASAALGWIGAWLATARHLSLGRPT